MSNHSQSTSPNQDTPNKAGPRIPGTPRQLAGPAYCPVCAYDAIDASCHTDPDGNERRYWVECENCGWCGNVYPAVVIDLPEIVLDEDGGAA